MNSIAEISTVVGGGTPSRDVGQFWRGSIPWLTPGEVSSEAAIHISATRENISKEGLRGSGATLLPPGSLMITTRATLGARAINTVPMTTNQGFKSLVFKVPSDALFYYFLVDRLKPEFVRRASGTTFLEVSGTEVGQIKVPVPPTCERALIAEILVMLDTTIRQTEAIIEKLKQIKKGLLHDLLTRGIDANGELRAPQSQAPHLYKDSPLGWIPNEWNIFSIGQIVESIVDGPFGSNLKTEHYVELPGVRVVRLQNIDIGEYDDTERAFVSAEKAANLGRNEVLPGDVLIAALGDESYPVGRACSYPTWLPKAINKADCFRLRPEKNRAIGEFVVHSLNGSRVRRQIKSFEQGVTLQRINIGNLRKIQILLPTISEQILGCEKLAAIQHNLAENMKFLAKSRHQRIGLMNDLLTGQVRVTPLLDTADA
ncbi:restriction endonuclease subunit S [Janthinobacterium lividum]|uniref:restriction endonuclease subunit S n=1 Tax=Janthinobacterium lividum TaxID=29581 RepID=UPI001678273A